VVPEQQVAAGWNRPTLERLVVPPAPADPRLREHLAADQDRALALAPALARQSDHPLDEQPAGAAAKLRGPRRLEDDDVTARRHHTHNVHVTAGAGAHTQSEWRRG